MNARTIGRRCMMAAVVSVVMVVFFSVGAIPEPPPTPPVGWEEQITPGFEPAIERSLVEDWWLTQEEVEAYAEQWGEGAFDVLRDLWERRGWEGFAEEILRLMLAVDAERAEAFMPAQFESYVQQGELERPESKIFYDLINQMYQHMPEQLLELTKQHVGYAAPDVQRTLIFSVLRRMPSPATLQFLRDFEAQEENSETAEDIQRVIDHVAGVLRARELMEASTAQERGTQ